MSRCISRGALIVLEGCDRSGKSTQCVKLVESLNAGGVRAKLWRFPDRDTPIGKIIGQYLEQKSELEDHAVHLLFTANRWEAAPRMKELLANGTTLVVDRYSYSGVAFSAAKKGMDFDWCRQPEVGLPRPDAVVLLQLSAAAAATRAAYGLERYEHTDFQRKVAAHYDTLQEPDWIVIDANKSIEELHKKLKGIADKVIASVGDTPISQLWWDEMNDDDK